MFLGRGSERSFEAPPSETLDNFCFIQKVSNYSCGYNPVIKYTYY